MKAITLHKYIKYTTVPYSELIAKAKKSMDTYEVKGGMQFIDKEGKEITLYWHNPQDVNEGVLVGYRNW